MYLIDKSRNRIKSLSKKTFSELDFRERDHLQEWIANKPNVFGEDDELLIIQKEFSGFNDTNERLDLLALDKSGNLVIIENKLDDSGRDVTWQILKYASYCSTLSKEQIKDIYQNYLEKIGVEDKAADKLTEFYNQDYEEIVINKGNSQRLILVAANFRKEVTSTVLWLMNYKLKIQCFKVTPFSLEEQLFLTFEQIIPTKDTEDFIISVADKNQDEIVVEEKLKTRHLIRKEFWTRLIPKLKGKLSIYQNSSPTTDHWLNAGGGMQGTRYSLVITKNYAGVQFEFAKPNQEENKRLFDELLRYKDKIEENFGYPLQWERGDDKVKSLVSFSLQGVNIFDKNDWDRIEEFLIINIINFEKSLRNPLSEIRKVIFMNNEEENE